MSFSGSNQVCDPAMRCPLKRAVDSVVVVVGTVLQLHVTVVGEDTECRILRVFCL